MIHSNGIRKIFIYVIIPIIIACGIAYWDFEKSKEIFFVIEMETTAYGTTQVFFDIGAGYNEKDSERLPVLSGVFNIYSFPLPTPTIKSLRFDPLDRASVIRIKAARIENGNAETIRNFPYKSFKPQLQIVQIEPKQDMVVIHTEENANDPYLYIENSSITFQQVIWGDFLSQHWWIYVGYGLLCFIAFLLLGRVSGQYS